MTFTTRSKRDHMPVLALVLATMATVAACGSSQSATTSTPQTLIAKFKTAGLPVASTYTFTAENDPNHLLGRPNGYVAKMAWTDSRIKASDPGANDSPGGVGGGGSIEQYPDHGGAKSRARYIQSAEKALPMMGTEYDYVVGNALVRVSSQLTPAQAEAYKKATS